MPLAPRSRTPAHGTEVEYRAYAPSGRRIGIALSGGGVRSAAFNLGALQALQEARVLASAEYLAAVSGGNYIASAVAISHAYADPGCENGRPENGTPMWAHGSPEERYLRRSTNYLAPGYVGRVWLVASVLCGFVLNYLPFLLSAFIIGRCAGWLVHLQGIELADLRLNGLALPASGLVRALLVVIAICVVSAMVLVAVRRLRDGRHGVSGYGTTHSEPLAAYALAVAGLAVLLLVLPALAQSYGTVSRLVLEQGLGEAPTTFDTMRGRIVIAVGWLLLALALAVTALVLGRRRHARSLMLALSALGGAGLLLVPLLSALEYSARRGVQSVADLVGIGVAVVVLIFMGITIHNRRYSLHLFYRERLNNAFALRRSRDADGEVIAAPLDYRERLYFSKIGERLADSGVQLPRLVVCCAVNVTSDEVPVGRFAESFTFEHDTCGGPRFGYPQTARFEKGNGPRGTDLTLPSIMAVSGAAVSPLMGRFTYPPMRFLMALTNVRLGVWIPNPKHESWGKNRPEPRGRIGRLRRAIIDGWREPGALYVLREALGTLTLNHRFIYLTDGGHWENLGLVELLRRRCTDVLCFDASVDQTGAGQDLGRAIALARSELGIDVELDPRPVLGGHADGFSADVAVRGTIHYPDQQDGRLVYAKATLTDAASWDLHAFKARDGHFPNHATSQQIFTDEQFEAYRSLGHAAGRRAVELLNIPPAQLAENSANGAARSVGARRPAGTPIPVYDPEG
jgi:hypothetical protein